MTKIVVRTTFDRLHRWKNAPEAVSFLRDYHRHVFHIELQIEVFHDDRELEFILVKNALNTYLSTFPERSDLSCEMIAKMIIEWARGVAPGMRKISCGVFEDGENGAVVF